MIKKLLSILLVTVLITNCIGIEAFSIVANNDESSQAEYVYATTGVEGVESPEPVPGLEEILEVETDVAIDGESSAIDIMPLSTSLLLFEDKRDYPLAPFYDDIDSIESVDLSSGSLRLNYVDFSLPGKDGFDLTLARQYDSSQSNTNIHTPTYLSDKMWRVQITAYFQCRFDSGVTTQAQVRFVPEFNQAGFYYASQSHANDVYDEMEDDIKWYFYRGDWVEFYNYNTGRWDSGTVAGTVNLSSKSTSVTSVNSIMQLSSSRPNNHDTDLYGIGQGWSFGFPSVEVVGTETGYRKSDITYQSYLHVGDGRSYRIDYSRSGSTHTYNLKSYNTSTRNWVNNNRSDVSFRYDATAGASYGANHVLTFKDGRKAYFSAIDNTSLKIFEQFKLLAMEDRFGNVIRFNLNKFSQTTGGGTITDSLGRTINVTKTGTNADYTIRWSFPGENNTTNGVSVSYRIVNNRLTEYTDPQGYVTLYGYIQRSLNCQFRSEKLGWGGENVQYILLSSITHPSGLVSNYAYEEKKNMTNEFLEGYDTVPYISRRYDVDGLNWINQRDYTYTLLTYRLDSTRITSYAENSVYGRSYTWDFNVARYVNQATVQKTGPITTSEVYLFNYTKPPYEARISQGNTRKETITYTYNDLLSPLPTIATKTTEEESGSPIVSTTRWAYDDKGNVTSFTDPMSNVTTTTYDTKNSIPTKITYKKDSSTNITEDYTLNSTGTLVTKKTVTEGSALKERTEYLYTGNNLTETRRYYYNNANGIPVDASLGTSTTYSSTTYSYANTNPSLPTTYNNVFLTGTTVSGVTDADGIQVENVAESYMRDAWGRVIEHTDPNGNLTKYQYDRLGRTTQVTNPDDSTVETAYTLTSSVNRVVTTDENGDEITYNYNKSGDISQVLAGSVVMNDFTYNSLRQLTRAASYAPSTSYEHYTYDWNGRVKQKKINTSTVESGSALYQENYNYTGLTGNVSQTQKTVLGTSTTDPSIVTSQRFDLLGMMVGESIGSNSCVYTYDSLGNRLSTTDPLGRRKNYTYDYAGRTTSESQTIANVTTYARNTFDHLGNQVSTTDFIGNTATYRYDKLGRVIVETLPLDGSTDSVKKYYYDPVGNIKKDETRENTVNGTLLSHREYNYDSRNWLKDLFNYKNASQVDTTSYQYYPTGNISQMTTGGNTTKYEYDHFGNVTRIRDAQNQDEIYTYDQWGVLKEKRFRSGNLIELVYDELGRVIREDTRKSASLPVESSTTYNYGLTGARLSESNANLTTNYVYNNLGQLTSQTDGDVTKTYTYDAVGNRKTFALAKGSTVLNLSYNYDDLNRLSQVLEGSTLTETASYTYDNNSNVKTYTNHKNGVTSTYSYNHANLVTNIVPDKGTLPSYAYEYRADGNQTKKTETLTGSPAKVTNYQYDMQGRLTSESVAGLTTTYAFDSAGNRDSVIVMTVSGTELYTIKYEYDSLNRLLRGVKTEGGVQEVTSYGYDANGNTLSTRVDMFVPKSGAAPSITMEEGLGGIETFEYNAQNQLIRSYNGSDAVVEYTYRPDGLRHEKTVNGNTTRHLWDGANIVAEAGADGVVHEAYIRGLWLIASKDLDNGSGGSYTMYNQNAHGDVVHLTDVNGAVITTYDYDAFGMEKELDQGDTNPFRYCGEYWDADTGTYYLRARNYAPGIGRFSQEDPASDGLNLYVYANNNPMIFFDPSGLAAVNFVDYITALGGAVKSTGEGKVSVTVDGKTSNWTLNSGIMDDTKINELFGFSSFLTDAERNADVGIAIKDNKLYYDISTPVANALLRDVGMFEAKNRIWNSEVYKNLWFASEVGDKGPWNLKYREGDVNHWELTLGIPFWGYQTEMYLHGHWVIVEDVGNITYGYLGAAVGFSQSWLDTGSAINHFGNHGFSNWDNERADQANFGIGINWYKTGAFNK